LAEQVYQQQLDSLPAHPLVLENKASTYFDLSPAKQPDPEKLSFLFSGTLGVHTGILDVLRFFQRAGNLGNWELIIAGYTPKKHLADTIRKLALDMEAITLLGIDERIPYEEIVSHVRSSSIGLIAYQQNPSIDGKFPTKLYEYLAASKLILASDQWQLPSSLAGYQGLLSVDFKTAEPQAVFKHCRQLLHQNPSISVPKDVYFDSKGFINYLNNIILKY